jgi:anthranilate synthase/aminodeoxychorismate synthase-like glutamine amidotransferase
MKEKVDILMIDNYDSFTFNLVQYFGILGMRIKVFRNDEIDINQIKRIDPDRIVISPGPGWPKDAGISKNLIKKLYKSVPILGVCLGHQCIGDVFGAKITYSGRVLHGKTSLIYHDGKTIFKDIKNPFSAARYHSLIINKDTIPECLEISATSDDGCIMAVRHKDFLLEGVQFHPESILTKEGIKVLKNFIGL